MNENLKIISKISRISLWAWTKVLLLGSIFVLADLIIGFYLIASNPQSGMAAGHVNGPAAILVFFMVIINYFATNFFPSLLILAGFLNIPLFIVLANKQAISSFMYSAYTYKLTDFIEPKVQKLISKILAKQPNFTKQIPNWKIFRVKLIQENKNDSTSSWFYKKITGYCLKKIRMDDVNFSDPNLNYAEVITTKLKQFIQETLEPSMLLVWIACGVNILLIILAIFL
ncbi:TPA: hypothetical protein ACG0AO_003372 [Elizabethkingia meningoseptica]|uniref:hypothetical protein n=1 Tax=Elizabethkingia meningoseptica TaxID=238 RepID=UPI0023AF0406|nr:hypothetical protein [Elizabethkingia meningoseptica]MDE5493296.1 hypothetical protein [Elizabethkingia meningoseptica]